MKKIILIIISITIFSCNKDKTDEFCTDCNSPYELESTSLLSKGIVYDKAMQLLIESNITFTKSGSTENPEVTIASYKNSDVKAIIIPLESNEENSEYSFVTYSIGDKVLDDFVIIINKKSGDNISQTQFFNRDNVLLGEIVVQNNKILKSSAFFTKSAASFGSAWNDCVKAAIDRMGYGDFWGNIEFLACVAFGPSCAAGIIIGCAGVALTE